VRHDARVADGDVKTARPSGNVHALQFRPGRSGWVWFVQGRTLHVGEGDEVEFSLHDDGTVTVRGFVSIPTDQAWFFTPEWLAGEQEADNEIAAGRGTEHDSADAMLAHLEGLGAADE
jgi:hypothetical protein